MGADAAAVEALVDALGDDHPKVRATAADVLADGPSLDVGSALVRALHTLPDTARPGHRAAIAYAMGLLHPDHAPVDALVGELDHADSDVRFHALTALNRLGCSAAAFREAIEGLLADADPEVAAVAATSAADFGMHGLTETILDRWRSSTGFSQRHFALAAARLGSDEVADTLARAFSSGVDALDAADELVRLGGKPARHAFTKVVRSWMAHPVLKARAAVGLFELDSSARGPLDACLSHRKALVRHAAIDFMGDSPHTDFAAMLAELTERPRLDDAVLAVAALGNLAERSVTAREALENIAGRHPKGDLRDEADAALQALAGGDGKAT